MFRGETRMGRLLLSIALLAGLSGVAFGQTSSALEIAPGGKLRVGMIAITVLGGVAEPVAGFVAQKLGATVEPVMYPTPDAYLLAALVEDAKQTGVVQKAIDGKGLKGVKVATKQ
jgi:hypothetical protein